MPKKIADSMNGRIAFRCPAWMETHARRVATARRMEFGEYVRSLLKRDIDAFDQAVAQAQGSTETGA